MGEDGGIWVERVDLLDIVYGEGGGGWWLHQSVERAAGVALEHRTVRPLVLLIELMVRRVSSWGNEGMAGFRLGGLRVLVDGLSLGVEEAPEGERFLPGELGAEVALRDGRDADTELLPEGAEDGAVRVAHRFRRKGLFLEEGQEGAGVAVGDVGLAAVRVNEDDCVGDRMLGGHHREEKRKLTVAWRGGVRIARCLSLRLLWNLMD